MNFTVTARVSARRFAFQHSSLLNALDQGMSLVAAGMADVRIADGSGPSRTPADLYRHLFEARAAEGVREPGRPGAAVALAA